MHPEIADHYARGGAFKAAWSQLGYRYVELAADLSATPHFAVQAAGDEDIRAARSWFPSATTSSRRRAACWGPPPTACTFERAFDPSP